MITSFVTSFVVAFTIAGSVVVAVACGGSVVTELAVTYPAWKSRLSAATPFIRAILAMCGSSVSSTSTSR